jgi:hypothetical protein
MRSKHQSWRRSAVVPYLNLVTTEEWYRNLRQTMFGSIPLYENRRFYLLGHTDALDIDRPPTGKAMK